MITLPIYAKKSKGLDGLVEGFSTAPPEETSKVTVESNSVFTQLIQKLEEYIGLEKSMQHSGPAEYQEKSRRHHFYLRREVTEILPPAAINGLLQLMTKYVSPSESETVRRFLTHLLQQSYDAGHNDFYLDTMDVGQINKLGDVLRGNSKRALRINVDGPIGNYFLSEAYRVAATFRTDLVPLFTAHKVRKSNITIYGAAGVHCGNQARYSSFIIKGEPGYLHMGYGSGMSAWFSNFTLIGFSNSPYDFFDSKATPFGCTFRTHNEETMGNIVQHLPLGNRAIFIHPDGREETLWKKHFVERMKYKMR